MKLVRPVVSNFLSPIGDVRAERKPSLQPPWVGLAPSHPRTNQAVGSGLAQGPGSCFLAHPPFPALKVGQSQRGGAEGDWPDLMGRGAVWGDSEHRETASHTTSQVQEIPTHGDLSWDPVSQDQNLNNLSQQGSPYPGGKQVMWPWPHLPLPQGAQMTLSASGTQGPPWGPNSGK